MRKLDICAIAPSVAHRPLHCIKAHNRRRGVSRDGLDTQIAAQAVAEGLVLVTHNTRHFADTPGLRLEDWMQG
ncbi:hypothetical protein GCM10023144_43650 [Pigmentiphaga soli]|uniref:PIN domain-containing protein n=1 Tax=Pigmentiphaga soli TaxID=1007095 RepID=A0ABP8HP96_9BURK